MTQSSAAKAGNVAGIQRATAAAVNAYNTGGLDALVAVSCGALKTDLAQTTDAAFRAEARTDHQQRGEGRVASLRNVKILNDNATADVILAYQKHVEGLDGDNEVHAAGVYQRDQRTWRICGLG